MQPSLDIAKLEKHFKDKLVFTSQDLLEFYALTDKDITRSTLYWRIFSLVKQGHIKRMGRGLFSLNEKLRFTPLVDKQLVKVNSLLKKKLPFAQFCLWNTKLINQWMLHQPFHFFTLVEVEKDALESVFHSLQDHYANVFLKPSGELIQRYTVGKPDVLIVLPLISEAPLQNVGNVSTITLEKLIVDLFCEPDIFAAHQGSELAFIYDNLFSKYSINLNRMMRYADRRKKKKALLNYLETNTNFRQ